ncbi:class III lanthionine synthetase LanKC [Nonomuraea sp. NPDC059023]|uniref:class III lanthionine synthetase LanKC n=1 Tax=unclassified Nonomuraea TaxID=2593643 RepID=UPI00368E7D9E
MRYEQFSFTDPLFYDLPSRSPLANRRFAAGRPVPAGWQREERDVWTGLIPPGTRLPMQGWKIHVSAAAESADKVVCQVWDYCVPRTISFKYLTDHSGFHVRNGKYADRGGSGKLLTLYPDATELEQVLTELGDELAGTRGPYILSDVRWRDGPLYVRYGAFVERHCLDARGEQVAAISTPDGRLVPDRREPEFVVPEWVEVPAFLEASVRARTNPDTPHEFPFLIERPLHFSNGGGVYLADDPRTGRRVVLKEARPFAGLDVGGRDAARRLRHERDFLTELKGSGTVPEPYDYLTCWEHEFLVEEYIEGDSLLSLMTGRYPLIHADPTEDEVAAYTRWALDVLERIAAAIRTLHGHGVAIGDFHPRNVMVRPDGQIRFVDLEVASFTLDETTAMLGAPGYAAPDGRTGAEADRYAMACLYLSMFLPLTALLPLDPGKATVLADAAADRFGVDRALFDQPVRELRDRRPAHTHDPGHNVARLAGEMDAGRLDWPGLRASLCEGIAAAATPERTDRLFPGDIEQFSANGLGMANGAAGVLHALSLGGRERSPAHEEWLLDGVRHRRHNSRLGFYDGLHGIAYTLEELGRRQDALAVLERVVDTRPERLSAGLYDGLAGAGLNLLRFAELTGEDSLRERAVAAGRELLARWETTRYRPGLLHGPSGQALLHIRLFEATGDQSFLDHAATALRADLAVCATLADGSVQVDEGWRMMPYIATGSVGIGLVLREYLRHREDEAFTTALAGIGRAARCEFVIGSGLMNGRAGFIAFLAGPREPELLDRHLRRLSWHLLPYRGHAAFPGEQLMRLSMDLATGSAGVLTALCAVFDGTPVLPFLTPSERTRSA